MSLHFAVKMYIDYLFTFNLKIIDICTIISVFYSVVPAAMVIIVS